MRGYSEDALDEVRAKSDIVEVVSEYVALKPAGKTYKGLCPFHVEKTPSFTVSREKQLFYCFGCGAGGDVFSFVMKAENVSFSEAAKLLAERAGVPLQGEVSQETREARERRRLLYEINEAACKYFQTTLLESSEAAEARAYLRKRGLSREVVERFRLGYALPSWDGALKALTRSGLSREALLAAGLVVPGKDRDNCYDRFRARLMFPISDASGRVIGFGGRVLDDSTPKYLNSPETALFTKGRNLYGLHLAKDAIRKDSLAVIVEGYMDAITCHEHGFGNVVASLGTALTKDQARVVSRYASQVVIAYDADAAGAAATIRGMEILAGAGLGVRVATLPSGEDPDSTLRKIGRDALSRALSNARSLLDYKLHVVVSRADRARIDGKVEAAREVARVLAQVESAVERAEYARKAARDLEVSEDALVRDVETLVKTAYRGEQRRRTPVQDRFGATRHTSLKDDIARSGEMARVLEAEKMLLRLMVENGDVLKAVLDQVGVEGFCEPKHVKIAQAIASQSQGEGQGAECGAGTPPARIMSRLEGEDVLEYAAGILVGRDDEMRGDPTRMAEDCLRVMHEYNLRGRIRKVERELASLGNTGEMERSRELLAELGSLRARLSKEFQPFSGIV
ncbi:MAG: DNA primase [Bacillota bacterium]